MCGEYHFHLLFFPVCLLSYSTSEIVKEELVTVHTLASYTVPGSSDPVHCFPCRVTLLCRAAGPADLRSGKIPPSSRDYATVKFRHVIVGGRAELKWRLLKKKAGPSMPSIQAPFVSYSSTIRYFDQIHHITPCFDRCLNLSVTSETSSIVQNWQARKSERITRNFCSNIQISCLAFRLRWMILLEKLGISPWTLLPFKLVKNDTHTCL